MFLFVMVTWLRCPIKAVNVACGNSFSNQWAFTVLETEVFKYNFKNFITVSVHLCLCLCVWQCVLWASTVWTATWSANVPTTHSRDVILSLATVAVSLDLRASNAFSVSVAIPIIYLFI